MFKNIFPNKLNRLVYKNGPETASAAEKAEKAKASPADLRKEAQELGKAIDDYAQQVIDHETSFLDSKADKNIKLDKPETYAHLSKGLRDVLRSLHEAKVALGEGYSRVNLDYVRVKVDAARTFYKQEVMRVGDPLATADEPEMAKVAKAKPKAKPKQKESVEASRFAKLASKAEELAMLDQSTPAGKRRADQLRTDIRDLADTLLVGKNRYVLAKGNMKIMRAKGPGTPAFKITMEFKHELEQQGRPGAKSVKRTETVYVGGSEKDFA